MLKGTEMLFIVLQSEASFQKQVPIDYLSSERRLLARAV